MAKASPKFLEMNTAPAKNATAFTSPCIKKLPRRRPLSVRRRRRTAAEMIEVMKQTTPGAAENYLTMFAARALSFFTSLA
jgi:hypothetical protein